MKFLLLKTLLKRKKDEGFTLPIVIAIGMVMVLLSAVDLVQSGEENLNAISQEGSADALAAAELGVSRYRDLLINNRVLAVNDLGNWTGRDNETCDVISDTGTGWANTNNWRAISLDENASSADLNSDGDTNDTLNVGSYRIIDYQYDRNGDNFFSQLSDDNDPDNNPATPPISFNAATNNHNDTDDNGTSDAIGTLTVQGQDATGSIAQLQVTFPLGVNTQDLEDLDPAIWITQNNLSANKLGIVDVNGSNIVLYRPSGLGDCNDPSDLNSNNTISDPRLLPPGIDQTAINSLTARTLDGVLDQNTGTGKNFFDSSPGVDRILIGTDLDDTGSDPALHTDGNYYYTTGSANLTVDAGEAIIADGNAKIILHVGGNLVIDTGSSGNRTRIVNSSHRTAQDIGASILQINNFTPSNIARYLEIHVEGNVEINGTGELFLTGLLRVDGSVSINDSSSIHIIGSVWANDWDNNDGGMVSVNIDDENYKFYSITPNRTPAPLTFRPSGWETQEAN